MLKLTDTVSKSSKRESGTGSLTMPPSGPIYVPSTVGSVEEWWTSLRAAFHARTSPSQGTKPDSVLLEAVSGGKCLESFGRWDRDTSSLRTFQASLFEDRPEPWSESFPPSGTMRSGTAYRLRPLVPRTSVGGGGALRIPTPNAVDGAEHLPDSWGTKKGTQPTNSLALMAKTGMWPTPQSMDAANIPNGNRENRLKKGDCRNLVQEVGGQLNPEFVTWLMGLPQGWTALEPLVPESWRRWQQGGHWDGGEWPGVPRVATGVPDRVSRLRALGNGIVPAVVAKFLRLEESI